MVYLDFPLGHTAGRANDVQSQRAVVMAALQLLEVGASAGQYRKQCAIVGLAMNAWKDTVMRPKINGDSGEIFDDDRVERLATPQYQSSADADRVTENCRTCVLARRVEPASTLSFSNQMAQTAIFDIA
ncbi:MAG: hypothetical protein CM1200mP9_08000 [Gammaproteobacteria bacterium]|nr:MAG: hypothetical protein CM1200mP9_08000 [Gammaproteobacteria bacterium]